MTQTLKNHKIISQYFKEYFRRESQENSHDKNKMEDMGYFLRQKTSLSFR